MRRLLIVSATARDRLNLEHDGIRSRFHIELEEGAPVDGVFGSSDSTAALAAVVSDRLRLPGPGYDAFMRCHDKLVSRRIQAGAVPDATPAFAAVDTHSPYDRPPLPFPFFIKPVQGHLSQQAYRVDGPERYAAVLQAARASAFRHLIAEELLDGRLVTLEGIMHRGVMTPIGVTDSVMHTNGISFLRFEYPTSLPDPPQRRMIDVARRLMPALGFDDSLFNIEFFVRPDGSVWIVEVNGRMASQFAPLVRAVHGVSTYEIGLELAAGGRPQLPPARPGIHATSFLLRTYSDAIVRGVPDTGPVLERFPHAQVEILVRPGQRLSENDDDVASHRLAVIALAGRSRREVNRRYAQAVSLLPFALEPLPSHRPAAV
jgi:biotin carboxylase